MNYRRCKATHCHWLNHDLRSYISSISPCGPVFNLTGMGGRGLLGAGPGNGGAIPPLSTSDSGKDGLSFGREKPPCKVRRDCCGGVRDQTRSGECGF